ncbi:unnamed protein product [Brassica oleracea var. botrytis]
MDNGILEVFPKLDEVPPGIASQFEEMIRCYLQTKSKTPTLDIFRVFKHVGQVYDDEGKLVCLCKASRDAKKEAAVYILDHPLSAHRSVSSELTGFGGATPTVFIRTEEASGCLVWFVENNNGVIGDHKHYQFSTLPEGISKLSIFHLRFGCADSHDRNTVTKIDAQKVHHLTPIDFEELTILFLVVVQYKLRRVWWDQSKEAKEAYTNQVVAYVNNLDTDEDLAFLKRCGWEVPREISIPYKIFTFFVKKGVKFNLTAAYMVVIAQNAHRSPAFNLLNMLADQRLEDDIFVQKSHEKIEARLRQYSERFL